MHIYLGTSICTSISFLLIHPLSIHSFFLYSPYCDVESLRVAELPHADGQLSAAQEQQLPQQPPARTHVTEYKCIGVVKHIGGMGGNITYAYILS